MVTNWRLIVIGLCRRAVGLRDGQRTLPVAKPVRVTLTGHVHFREFPGTDGIDNVPMLVLDKHRYIYAPPQSHHCLPANDVQLVGVAEFPQSIGENSHVIVDGQVVRRASRAPAHPLS